MVSAPPSPPPPPAQPVAAILLAAGRSRRMGAFKLLLPFGTRTVIETCVNNLLEAGVAEIVVVTGRRAADVRGCLEKSFPAAPIKFAHNPDEESEMGDSVARGAQIVSPAAGAILVALADCPAVEPETIRTILGAWREGAAPFVIPPGQKRGGHPVLLDAAHRAELGALGSDRSLRTIFDAHRREVLRLEVASPFVVRDLDTWDDYATLYGDVFGTAPPGPDEPTPAGERTSNVPT
jgi:molybdenum cofactor cytidylyltransferase